MVWVASLDHKEALIASAPEKFFTTPHYDNHPVVLVSIEAVDSVELTELIEESWRLRAPENDLP